jgi:hypothetical protein
MATAPTASPHSGQSGPGTRSALKSVANSKTDSKTNCRTRARSQLRLFGFPAPPSAWACCCPASSPTCSMPRPCSPGGKMAPVWQSSGRGCSRATAPLRTCKARILTRRAWASPVIGSQRVLFAGLPTGTAGQQQPHHGKAPARLPRRRTAHPPQRFMHPRHQEKLQRLRRQQAHRLLQATGACSQWEVSGCGIQSGGAGSAHPGCGIHWAADRFAGGGEQRGATSLHSDRLCHFSSCLCSLFTERQR